MAQIHGYVPAIMRVLRRTNWLQVFMAVGLLSFVGHRVTAEMEHIGFTLAHSHLGSHSHETDVPDSETPAQQEHLGHHHHSDMIFLVVEMQRPAESAFSFFSPDSRCQDGPVFDIDYPPQLS
jgi:hypothetical protein